MIGIYVHLPFCAHICPYCDFRKTSKFTPKDIKSYFEGLVMQWHSFLNLIPENTKECTVYFGGGTPSLFPASYYKPLVEEVKKRLNVLEFTIETNPLTNQQSFLKGWKDLGVNRITLGAQSLNKSVLSFLGRRHTPNDILRTLDWARSLGIPSIQVDLIYGLSIERPLNLQKEIEILACEGATGISAYGLTIENRTHFGQKAPAELAPYVSDEAEFEKQYGDIYHACQDKGWLQWEVSNYSQTPCLHNQQYWEGGWYIGIGTGAHGCVPKGGPWGQRYSIGQQPSQRSPGDDILIFSNPMESENNWSIHWEPTRNQKHMIEERLFTGLRTLSGLSKTWLENHIGIGILEFLSTHPKTKTPLESGGIVIDNKGIRLTWQEKLRSDFWAVEFAFLIESYLNSSN